LAAAEALGKLLGRPVQMAPDVRRHPGRRQDQRQDHGGREPPGQVRTLIIGGGMANTFLAAKGYDMQGSLVEAASIETAKAIMAKARAREGQP